MKRDIWTTILAMQIFTVTASAQTPALPRGRDLVLRSNHVTGADTILPNHTSMTLTGSLGIQAAGVTAPIVIMKSSSGEFHATIGEEGMGTVEQGYAEGTAWSINPEAGASILKGPALTAARNQALWMDSPDLYAKLDNQGIEKFHGRDAYKVLMETKDGAKLTRYYDITTGYNLGTLRSQPSSAGDVPMSLVLSDYVNFGGLMFPTKQVQTIGNAEQVFSYDDIKFDIAPKSAFALPAAVTALRK